MRIHHFMFTLLLSVGAVGCSEEPTAPVTVIPGVPETPEPEPVPSIGTTTIDTLDARLAVSVEHALNQAAALASRPDRLPRSAPSDGTGSLRSVIYNDWTSGFFPGTLWYLYEATGNPTLRDYAEDYTDRVEPAKRQRGTHDLGFVIYNSFGNGLRLSQNAEQRARYTEVIRTASNTLAERFNPAVGLIRSWDFGGNRWQYPVIIDNMMNLEMLLWNAETAPNPDHYSLVISHADRTNEEHFRPDQSSYHVVSYDPSTGQPHAKTTFQGLNDGSAWAREQSWGLYGYTMMYRMTGNPSYLVRATDVAEFLMGHPNLPEDLVPYWDYDAPASVNSPRDASAAALMVSALIELSDYQPEGDKERYLAFAERQLNSLSSPNYLAAPGTNENFILMHSVGHYPHRSEVDVGINYADYYYVEALLRLRERIGN